MKKKLKLGIIGAGGFSNHHLNAIQKLDCVEVLAISDIVLENAKTQAEKYNIPSYYQDHKELLARDDIEAVSLPLPDQVHAQITIDALKAGKHVLCEKPMALDLDECKEMIKVAEATGKQLMVGQVARYSPVFAKAKELIEKGALGTVYFIESEYAHDYSGIGGQGGWRVTPEREPIIGGGCHAVDLIRYLMGESPTEVSAYANNFALVDWPIHDCTIGIMKFPSGAIGKVFTSTGCKRKYTMRTVVQGTKGTLIFCDSQPYLSFFKDNFTSLPELEGVAQRVIEMRIPAAVDTHNVAAEFKDFCDAILENKPVITDGREGMATVAVCTSIVKSFKTGKNVVIDYEVK